MRVESLALRILLLAVLLVTVAVGCVIFLVLARVLHPAGTHMAGAGGGILFVAILAAAISALGPKYRPTPFLTPLAAGVFAALLATTAVYAAHSQVVVPKKRTAVAVAVIPSKPAAQPAEISPAMDTASLTPEPAAPVRTVGVAPAGTDMTPSEPPQVPLVAQPPPAEEIMPASAAAPADDVTSALMQNAAAGETPPAGTSAKAAATEKIPVPKAAPAEVEPGAPISLQAGFDASGPTEPPAGAPMVLAAAGKAPAKAAIPPLPRIRPCGGAGPACP